MSKQVEFFYDYVSSYSYLANSQLHTLGDARIVFRPMFLGAVMRATGNTPPAELAARGQYLQQDLQRWANHYGVPFRMNPKFPQNTLLALRLALVAAREQSFAALHELLFNAMWAERRDLSDDAVLQELVAAAGMDAASSFAAAAGDDIKKELKSNTDEAVARGAFGAPTFFVGEQMFFGNDRLDFVRAAVADATQAVR
jgi:2-hydroxychromene-2-carboxylate isomerase